LHLAKFWKTKRWQTRIQLELLGLTMVDAYLACRKIMPKWQGLDDMESIFWQFAYTIIAQIDTRPARDRVREGETKPNTALQTRTFRPIQGHVWNLQGQLEKQTSTLQILCREKKNSEGDWICTAYMFLLQLP
jgi:hypothetical protein